MLSDGVPADRGTFDLGHLRTIGSGPRDFPQRACFINSLPTDRSHNKRVVIFSTARSGSTYLADQIASSGLVGAPDEWLNPIWIDAVCSAKFAANVSEALDWIACRTSTANKIFSVNVQLSHYIHWKSKGFDLLNWGFEDAIYLEREDKISQAYSLAKARLHNKWEQTSSPASGQVPEKSVPLYATLRALSDILYWTEYFERFLKPHTSRTISYEGYLGDPQLILDLIAQFSGTRVASLASKSKLQKQQTTSDRAAIELLKSKIRL